MVPFLDAALAPYSSCCIAGSAKTSPGSPRNMVNRDALRGKAQAVLGIVDPAILGSTLMHEHLIWDIRPPCNCSGTGPGP